MGEHFRVLTDDHCWVVDRCWYKSMNFCTPHFGDYVDRWLNAYGLSNSSCIRDDSRLYVGDSTNCDSNYGYCTNGSCNRTNKRVSKGASMPDNIPSTKESSTRNKLD